MRDLVGAILDDTYRVERLIGQGGMGAVYAAHDLALDRDVAIKVMHDHIAREEGFRSRFLQEARAIAALDHPSIVRVYAFSRQSDLLYIVMAVIGQGHTLAEWLDRLSAQGMLLDLDQALALIEQLADALGYAHSRGVTHRDIKPGNILLQPLSADASAGRGPLVRAVLTDFGLAKLARSATQTLPGQAMGTPAYMAPEQCLGQAVDGRADIYALGVVLYQLATGQLPFAVGSLPEALQAHTRQAPPPPRLLMPDLPSEVERAILTTLAKAPAHRYQTGEALRDAIADMRKRYVHRRQDTPLAPASQTSAAWLTQSESAPAPRVDALPTPPSDGLAGARIVILDPEGRSETVPLPASGTLTVGREADSDLMLPATAVSRHHARISCEGQRVRVTDLNSTNGTFLEGERILPGVAERWLPGRRLRIGGYWLALEGISTTPTPPPAATHADRTPAPAGALELRLLPSTLSLEPSGQGQITAQLLNHQPHVDHFYARVEGLPGAWVSLPESDLMLAPEDGGVLAIIVRAPGDPAPLAGEHSFIVHVMSRADATRHAEAQGVVAIAAVRRVALSLHPSVYTDQGEGTLTVENQGNAAEQITLRASDPADAVEVQLAQGAFALTPGSSRAVAVTIKPGQRAPQGLHQTLPFAVQALVAEQPVAVANGALTVRPLPERAAPAPAQQAVVERAPEPKPKATVAKPKVAKVRPHPARTDRAPKRQVGVWRILLGLVTLALGVLLLGVTAMLWAIIAGLSRMSWQGAAPDAEGVLAIGAAGLVGIIGIIALVAGVRCLRGRAKLAIFVWLLSIAYVLLREMYG
jgi:serine/threonine protein kinase